MRVFHDARCENKRQYQRQSQRKHELLRVGFAVDRRSDGGKERSVKEVAREKVEHEHSNQGGQIETFEGPKGRLDSAQFRRRLAGSTQSGYLLGIGRKQPHRANGRRGEGGEGDPDSELQKAHGGDTQNFAEHELRRLDGGHEDLDDT